METGTLGLNVLWQQADVVTRGVALMLLVMSVASWYVMLDKLLRLALFRLRSGKLLAAFWARRHSKMACSNWARAAPGLK
ncbi:hypothetical protein [Pseudomonas helleri]|uniref:hypothetical protein n=1 Tax=Pseudomonas helleri TaxID=1608996 RepID=UPI001E4FA40A